MVGADFDPPNPVPYSAFTKVLGYYARDKGIMSQHEAVRRMTSLPARQMGLKDRGILRKGAYADTNEYRIVGPYPRVWCLSGTISIVLY